MLSVERVIVMPPLLGCAYYPEHWPQERWAVDAALMRQAGLRVVRLAEFAWDRMEPQPGVYDFGWLEQAITTLSAAGLQIVLCTPTATPPPWLTHAHPEICRVTLDGTRVSPGARRQACASVPAYQEAALRITEQIAQHFGEHPAVIGWQIDNEFGVGETTRCYCDYCRQGFQDWLAERYGSLDALNAAWGTQFWGMTYRDWGHIPIPGITNEPQSPSMRLDYRRFSSDNWVRFQRQQIALLHQYAPGRWITHNFMIRHWSLDYWRLAQELDFVSYDNYPHGLSDPCEVALNLDLMWSLKRRSFWVMEQQPGPVNWHPQRPPVPPGQVRVWTHQAVAHGAEAVVYFRFRAGRFGQEQYHTGLLKWDATPDQGYREAQAAAADLTHLPGLARPASRVGIVFDYDDLWSIELEPVQRDFRYWDLVLALYRVFWEANVPVDFLPRGCDPSGYDTLIVPAAILIHPGEVDAWREWVARGGRLIVTFRSGVRELSNIATDSPLPGGGLSDLLGVQVQDFCAVPASDFSEWPEHRPGTQVRSVKGDHALTYHLWAEALSPITAEPLYRYGDGLLTGQVAITRQRLGAGEAIYVGCWPVNFGELFHRQGWIAQKSSRLEQAQLLGGDGTKWRVTLNHSLQPVEGLAGLEVRYERLS